MTGVTDDTRAALAGPSRESRGRLGLFRLTLITLGFLLALVVPGVRVYGQLQSSPEVPPFEELAPPEPAVPVDPLTQSITAVQIDGNTTIPESAIKRYVKVKPGRPASDTQIRADLKALYQTRWFYSVEPVYRPSPEGLILVYRVIERPIVRQVKFLGNKKLKDRTLFGITGLRVGSPFDIDANLESVRRIRVRYQEKGHVFATVRLVKGDKPGDREVIFQINEGPSVRVVRTDFEGNRFFRDGLLRIKLATREQFLARYGIPFLKFNGKYNPDTVPDDLIALKDYYHSLGFFDVKIEKKIGFSKDRSKVYLKYIIEEGLRYKVRSIQLNGNQVLQDQQLAKDFKMEVGEAFNARDLTHDVDDMKSQYGELGRLFASVDAVPRFLEKEGLVDIIYNIDEDRVYRVRRVNVHIDGNHPHSKIGIVNHRTLVHPGDFANQKKIERGKRRLQGSQLVEGVGGQGPRVQLTKVEQEWRPQIAQNSGGASATVRGQNYRPTMQRTPAKPGSSSGTTPANRSPIPSIYRSQSPESPDLLRGQTPFPLYGDDPSGDPFNNAIVDQPPGWVDLDYYVNEARTGRLMFGVGVNSSAGVVGQIVLQESNFDLFRLPTSFRDVIDGTAFRGAGQDFRVELLPGNEVSRYSVSWTDPYFMGTDYSFGVSGFYYNRFMPGWDEERLGGRVTLGKQWTDEISSSIAFRGENVGITDPDQPTPVDLLNVLGDNALTTFKAAISHDTRDSSFMPSEGHLLQGTYEQAFGDFDFSKFTVEARQYFMPFSRPDGTGRHIVSVGGEVGWTSSDTPLFERFYAGGFQTFRGFAFRGISPRDQGVRIGGGFQALGSVEYMMPVTANDAFAVVAFTDFGTVDTNTNFDDFRVSVGFGFRVAIPAMGPVPLAFDFGFPIVKQDFDDDRIFSFYVGITR